MALQLEYRGSNYFISEEELNDNSITEMPAYLDEDLNNLADMGGGMLIFKKGQLEETTMASSAGAYEAPVFGSVVRRKIDIGDKKRKYKTKKSKKDKVVNVQKMNKPIGRIFSLGLKENILNKIIFNKVKLVMEDRTPCENPNEGEYFCTGGSDNLGATALYKDDGFDIMHKFGDYHLSDITPEEEETYAPPGTKKVKKTVLKPALHKAPFNVSLSEEKIDLYPKFTKKDLYSLMGESLNEDEAYKSATNNELALYVTILSNQKVAAKSRGKTEEVEYLEKDIEEVKKELQDRKGKESDVMDEITLSKRFQDKGMGKTPLEEEEIDETTTAASGAAGSYVTPQMWAKNRRNWRMAAKPTWKGGSFVKFKDRCVKYNNKKWCSQGAVDKPIELVSTLIEAATKISEETGKEVDYIAQLMSKRYSAPNEHLSDEVIELAKEHGYEVYAGVGQTEFTKQPNDGIEFEITVDGINGDIQAMIHNLEDNTFSGKTFDTFEDAVEYLENI